MHPTTSHQIATLQAAELRRRADLRHARVGARRSAGRHAASPRLRSSLAQTWALLTTFRTA